MVATPIGNLADISLRALDVLKQADVVAAEDTRVSAKLLHHYGIATRLISVREHNEAARAAQLIAWLRAGQSVALVTDAGTPAVSDPGAKVVAAVRAAGLRVAPIPGASAAITALSAAGLDDPHFLFYGFLPHKPGERRSALQAVRGLPYPIVFYESPHRIVACIDDLLAVLGGVREVTFARELTKTFEQIHTCALMEAPAWLAADTDHQRGEFVLIVSGAPQQAPDQVEAQRVLAVLLQELPVKQAAKLAAQLTGQKKNALYDLALRMRGEV